MLWPESISARGLLPKKLWTSDQEAEGEDNGVHYVNLCKDRDAVEKQALSWNVRDRRKKMTLRRTVKPNAGNSSGEMKNCSVNRGLLPYVKPYKSA